MLGSADFLAESMSECWPRRTDADGGFLSVLDVVLEELSQQQQEELPFRIIAEPAQSKKKAC